MRGVLIGMLMLGACSADAPVLSGRGFDGQLDFVLSLPEGRAHAGTTAIEVRATAPGSATGVEGLIVHAHAHMPAMDHEAEEAVLEPVEPGTYAGTLFFTMPGAWQVHIEAEGDEATDALLLDLDVG